MVTAPLRLLAATLALFTIGCAERSGSPPPAGELAPLQARAQRVTADIRAGLAGSAVSVHVADSPKVGAYAWPDGRIVLTRGLVERLDDDELAAAVAHEVGHLLADGHVKTVAALTGSEGDAKTGESAPVADEESRADAVAVRLLQRAGRPPEAMARALSKVSRSGDLSRAAKDRLAKRVKLLNQAQNRNGAGTGGARIKTPPLP